VYDINSQTLAAVVRENGGEPHHVGHVGDEFDDLLAALKGALAHDLVIVTGGSSVGTRDLLLDAFRDLGEVLFHGVAIRPGRPTLLARTRDAPILGMPGNPTSCLNNAYVFLAPMLRVMARLPPPPERTVRATLSTAISGPADKVTFVPVRLDAGEAVPVYKESGAITSMSRADGYVIVPTGGVSLEAAQEVDVIRF
jgi:molybdenum cofactor synthesis domain-containing protein